MCVLPASDLKLHPAIEKGLADEQHTFSFALGGMAASFFSSCMGLPMSTLWHLRQCCQGAEISAEKLNRAEKYLNGLGK
jgi:hypothetical protein